MPRPFLEYHYYRGGHRTGFIGSGQARPGWAPPAERVGFRDEVPLGADDLAIEIAKFEGNGFPVSWIGAYRRSPDQIYGDRRNHAGIGVWLPGKWPSAPALLIDDLDTLLRIYQQADAKEFTAKAKAFTAYYLADRLADYRELPSPLSGLQAARTQTQLLASSGYLIDREAEDYPRVLDDLVFRLFFFLDRDEEGNTRHRAIVLRTGQKTIESLSGKGLEIHKSFRFASDFLISLPEVFESQARENSKLHSALGVEKSRTGQLETALDTARERASEIERENKELRTSLEGNDEHRWHAAILKEMAGIRTAIQNIALELGQSRSAPSQPPPGTSIRPPEDSTSDGWSMYDWLKISAVVLGIAIVLVLIILVIVHLTE